MKWGHKVQNTRLYNNDVSCNQLDKQCWKHKASTRNRVKLLELEYGRKKKYKLNHFETDFGDAILKPFSGLGDAYKLMLNALCMMCVSVPGQSVTLCLI